MIGLALGTAPRMYPIGLLDTYEVINDEADGMPFVVARCALTDLTAIFDRRVAGRVLTFENSGALWRDMLVLKDRETGTWWTPATGRALFGPLAGERLTGIPGPHDDRRNLGGALSGNGLPRDGRHDRRAAAA